MKRSILVFGLLGLTAAQAPQDRAIPRIAAPDLSAQFSATRGAIKFDPSCRDYTLADLGTNPICAARVAKGETAPSLAVAARTLASGKRGEDPAAALAVLERAIAVEDHPAAHYFLASVLASGERLVPDYTRAAAHLEKAVAGGNVAAADLLASLALEGRGMKQDIPRAISLYERAAAGGMQGSASRLALLYLQGAWLPKDEARGRAILEAAAAAGDQRSSSMLAMLSGKVTNYQLHPSADRPPEVRAYGMFDNPPIPPALGYTDDFRKVHLTAYSDPATLARLERDYPTLPTSYIYELARRIAPASPAKARGYWMLARLRTVYDARRCTDPEALQAVGAWDTLVLRDLQFAVAGMTQTDARAAVQFALDRDAAMSADTRPWWLCYSGLGTYAAVGDKKPVPLSLRPAAEWPKIREEVRQAIKALPDKLPPQ